MDNMNFDVSGQSGEEGGRESRDGNGVSNQRPTAFEQRAGWNEPRPKELPRPTYWPVVFAMGVFLILWGFLTSFILSGVGVIILARAIAGWIGEVRYEHEQEKGEAYE